MSGEQWFEGLPSTWNITRLGALGSLTKGSGGSKEDNRGSGVAVVRYGELYSKFGRFIREAQSFVSTDDAHRYTPLPTGSLVFAASGEDPEQIGKSALSLLAPPALVGGDSVIFSPRPGAVDTIYLTYVLDSQPLRACKAVRSTGFTVVHISAGELKTLPVPLPTPEVQRAIAEYLDRETAQIDELVAKQENFIMLLRERKNAVISSAIQQATSRVKLKFVAGKGQYGLNFPASGYVDYGVRLLRTTDVAGDRISPASEGIFVPEQAVTNWDRLATGDLLLSRSGTIGRGFLVPPEADGMAFAGFLVRFRPGPDIDCQFLSFCAQSTIFQQVVKTEAVASTIQNFNANRYGNIKIPIAPKNVQHAIVRQIKAQNSRIDTLIAKAKEHIALAKERRAALITAAVTGQIDVRTAAQKAS